MTNTKEITVTTALEWTSLKSRFGLIYSTNFNGKNIRLIKGFGQPGWLAKYAGHDNEVLPFEKEEDVNSLVLKVESFLMN